MARGDYPSSKQDQFVLRFPEGMRDRIKEAAERNSRSMNAEIIATLEGAYPDPQIAQELNFADEIDDLMGKLNKLRSAATSITGAKSNDVEIRDHSILVNPAKDKES